MKTLIASLALCFPLIAQAQTFSVCQNDSTRAVVAKKRCKPNEIKLEAANIETIDPQWCEKVVEVGTGTIALGVGVECDGESYLQSHFVETSGGVPIVMEALPLLDSSLYAYGVGYVVGNLTNDTFSVTVTGICCYSQRLSDLSQAATLRARSSAQLDAKVESARKALQAR